MPGEVTKLRLDQLEQGINDVLNKVDSLLAAEAYAETLPIIGTHLAGAANAVQTITMLRDAVRNGVDAVSNVSNLATLTTGQVQGLLNAEINNRIAGLFGSGYNGGVSVNVDTAGMVTLVVDSGRTTSVDFTPGDLGMSGLGIDMQGTATAALNYNLDFRIGIDGSGVFLDTNSSNLSLGANVSLNNLSATTTLGPLKFVASNIPDSDPASGADTLQLALGASWTTNGIVRNFTSDLLDVKATGAVDLDVHLAADLGNAALPSVSSDLHVNWAFNQSLLNGSSANSWGAATVLFDHVKYSFGSFVEQFITPILEKLDPILQPINEALRIFRTDVSGVLPADWAAALDVVPDGVPGVHKVTLLDFLQLASNFAHLNLDLAPLQHLITTVDQITDFVEFFRGRDFADDGYDIGNYQVQLAQIQGAATTLQNLNLGTTGTFTSTAQGLTSFLASIAGHQGYGDSNTGTGIGAGETGAQMIAELVGNPILSFPLIENPLSVIQLLLGQDIDLFKLDMPKINLGVGLDANGDLKNPLTVLTFPVWPLPPVTVNVNVAAQAVIDLAFGYDTSGLRAYATNGYTNPLLIFNGFYLDDQVSNGVDTPEIVIRAGIELAVEAGLGLTIGGGGNLIGEIALDLADAIVDPVGSTVDHKLHLNEFPVDYFNPSSANFNPFGIFDVSGRITAGFRAYVNGPFGNIWQYNSPRLELANFSSKADAVPPGPPADLGTIINGNELWVNVGNRAGLRALADHTDHAESIDILAGTTPGSVVLSGFETAQSFSGITTIQVDANAGNDEIVMAAGLAIAARITGGAGADYLEGGAANDQLYGGTEDDYLVGNAGADQLWGEDGNDYLEGGAGGDALHGGAGLDYATYINSANAVTVDLTTGTNFGDAAGDTYDSIEIIEGSRHDDTLIGGNGNDIFTAIEGNDTLKGMGGDDILAGGLGTNSLDGGDGFDIVNYYNIAAPVTVVMSGTNGVAISGPVNSPTLQDTLTSIEQVNGTPYGDTMTGGDGTQIFVGAGGDDTLDGGDGDDVLMGGTGGDTLIGGAGIDAASYLFAEAGVTANLGNRLLNTGEAAGDSYSGIENLTGSAYDDTLTGDGGANFLYGGIGDDTLAGGNGDDTLEGGPGTDTLQGGAGYDTASYLHSSAAITLDLLAGTRAGDAVGDSFSSIEVYQGSNYGDIIAGTSDGETILGAGGDDTLSGNGGDDSIDGGDGMDTIHGGAGIDGITGGDGNDWLYGDSEADVLIGAAGNDHLYGGADNDTLSGGLGNDYFDGGTGFDIVTYADSTSGVLVNMSGQSQLLNGATINALTAADGLGGGTDTFLSDFTLNGESSVEQVTGSDYGDWMVGRALATTLDGGAGDDHLRGLGAADTLLGGAGLDTLEGGGGNDYLVGGADADHLFGNDDNDVLNGGAGLDEIDGGAGIDMVDYEDDLAGVSVNLKTGAVTDGSGAHDTLNSIEQIRGSGYGDTLTGDDGVNRIEGLAGNDVIDGGLGADTLVGGLGDDIYYTDNNDGPAGTRDVVVEAFGEGSDLVRTTAEYTRSLDSNVEDLQLLGSVVAGTGNSLNNRLIGNAAANILDGQGGSDTFWGYGGNDVYYFDSLGDTVGIGAAPRGSSAAAGEIDDGGVDEIRLQTTYLTGISTAYTYSLDTSWGQWVENVVLQDNDRLINLTGNARDNLLVGNTTNQTLSGGDGNDVLDPVTGRDTVDGGAGSDRLKLDWSSVTDYEISESVSSGSLTTGYSGRLHAYYDYQERNRVDFSGIENFTVRLGQSNDTLRTGDGDDDVWGNAGNDWLSTYKGLDNIDGGAGDDRWTADKSATTADTVLDLNAAVSTYAIGGATATVKGIEALGYGTDVTQMFRLGSGNDAIVTHTGFYNDYIMSGAGNDQVTISGGRDTIDLEAGVDRLVIDWSSVTDYGLDQTVLSGSFAAGYSGRLNAYYDYEYRNRVDFSGVEHFTVRLGQQNDNLLTGDGDDNVWGNAGDDFLSTAKGADNIDGGTGDDRWTADKSATTVDVTLDLNAAVTGYTIGGIAATVRGIEMLGASADELFKLGSGNDTVTTRTGFYHDYLDTGAGDDRVVLTGGRDVVAMGAGADSLVIDWSGVTDYAFDTSSLTGSLAAGYAGTLRAYYDYAERNRVDFSGVERFEVKLGQAGDNLYTGDGNDDVWGNGGDDYLNTGKGADNIDGGSGDDRWMADKSATTANVTLDLNAAVTGYTIGGIAATVKSVESLGLGSGTGEQFALGSGNDTVTTRTGFYHDYVATGAGDDRVVLSGGRDFVAMESGFDSLVIDWSNILDYAFDVTTLSGTLATGYSGQLRANYDYAERNRVDFSGVERFEVKLGQANDNLRTGDGNDDVSGNGGDDWLSTGKGADTIDGGTGNDRWLADKSATTADTTIDLTAGAISSYTIGAVTATVRGIESLGNSTDAGDRFVLGSGNDTIVTSSVKNNDYIETGAGNDSVKLLSGHDSVWFGAGSDTLVIDWSNVTDYAFDVTTLTGTLAGGYSGQLRANYNYEERNEANFYDVERFDVKLGAGNDILVVGDANNNVAMGGGDDTLYTGKGADTVDGGAGTDRLYGDKSATTADTTIDLGAVSSYTIAGVTATIRGFEVLGYGTDSSAQFKLGSGNDTIVTTAGNLYDYIDTGAGDDSVKLFAGHDTVVMGAGFDTLVLDYSNATDYNIDFGSLTGSLATGYAGEIRSYYNYDGRDAVAFSGVERFDVTLGAGNDGLTVGDANNIVRMGGGDDFLIVGNGNNTIDLGSGDDTVYVGAGIDVIEGGAGIDRLWGDKSASSSNFTIDATDPNLLSSYTIGGVTGSIRGIEAFGKDAGAGGQFRTGSGNDSIVTANLNQYDYIDTGAGDDSVKVYAGHDQVLMGAGFDTLVIDYSAVTDYAFDYNPFTGTLAGGYSGELRNGYNPDGRASVGFTGVERFDIRTGAGNDVFSVGDANDVVSTGAGDDTLWAGLGADTLDGGIGIDRLTADKSATASDMVFNLNVASTVTSYTIGGVAATIQGFEQLGRADAGDVFKAGSGNDTIVTSTLNLWDDIDTGAGNDSVTVYQGHDLVAMGAGTDTLIVDYSAVTDYGLDYSVLNGSLAAGYSGEIRAGYSPDGRAAVAFSGVERFDVTLGSGNDVLTLGDANNTARLGGGNDVLYVGTGNNTIDMGSGDDAVYAATGVDTIDGGTGIDRLFADKSATSSDMTFDAANSSAITSYTIGGVTGTLTGFEVFGRDYGDGGQFRTGSGNDTIVTANLNQYDMIDTGAGNDTVKVYAGHDQVLMGAGFDTLVIDYSAVTDYAFDYNLFTGTLAGGYSGELRNGYNPDGRASVGFTGVERFDIRTGAGNDVFSVGDANDVVSTGAGDDMLWAGLGADTLDGGTGIDRLTADKSASASDMVFDLNVASTVTSYTIGGVTATIQGFETLGRRDTNDVFKTGSGNDTIVTSTLNLWDDIDTGAGNDSVTVYQGHDLVAMGAGTDTLIVDYSAVTDYGLDYSVLNGSLAAGYSGEIRAGYSPDGRAAVAFSGVERFDVTLGAGDDVLTLGDANNTARLGAGNDAMYAGTGADTLDGGTGMDRLTADKSATASAMVFDLNVASTVTSYTIAGVTATIQGFEQLGRADAGEVFKTGSGDDTIITNKANYWDDIDTGAGNDRVTVYQGHDIVAMGAGTDTLVVNYSAITAYAIDYGTLTGSLAAGYSGEFRASYSPDGRAAVSFSGVEHFDVTLGAGNDYLTTGDGNDFLRGGAGIDTLNGGGGDDVIDGGTGNDVMTGGTGNDLYFVDSAFDQVIESAGGGADEICTALDSYSMQFTANVENLTAINATRGQALTGNALGNTITGGAFADILNGGGGNDMLYGGGGDDVLVAGGGEVDQMFGGSGTDTLLLTGLPGSWGFSQLGDGRVQVTDLRDAGQRALTDNLLANGGFETQNGSNSARQWILGSPSDYNGITWRMTGSYYGWQTASGYNFEANTTGTNAGFVPAEGNVAMDFEISPAENFSMFQDVAGLSTGQSYHLRFATAQPTGGSSGASPTATLQVLWNGMVIDTINSTSTTAAYHDYDVSALATGTGAAGANRLEFREIGTGSDGRGTILDDVSLIAPAARIYLTSVERVQFATANLSIADALAHNYATVPAGTSGDDVTTMTGPGLIDLSQGGNDTATGSTGSDGFYLGAALNAGDHIDGGGGTNDQVAIQGDYTGGHALVLGSTTFTNIGTLVALPGFSYSVTLDDGNVAPGARLTVYAGALEPGQNFTLNGSAEQDGSIVVYGGRGINDITTGAKDDGIYFGPGAYDPVLDKVDAGAGANDQMALDGVYNTVIDGTRIANVEGLVLFAGTASNPSSYNLTIADSWTPNGGAKYITAISNAIVSTPITIDASAEQGGALTIYAGLGADTITTGGGADTLYGGRGGDRLTGGAGADTYVYAEVAESTGTTYDTIVGLAAEDRIKLATGQTVTTIDATRSGSLSAATITAQLQAAFGDGTTLGSHHAAVFTATGGDLSGATFLAIDANGVGGYQAGSDYLIRLEAPPATLATAMFVTG